MTARTPVAGTPAQPPRYGLLAALGNLVTDDPLMAAGITWRPEQCGDSGRAVIDCRGGLAARTAADGPDVQVADPFAIWASDQCSPFGFGAIDYAARARRQLAATQSFEVAEELWTGSLTEGIDGLENSFLSSPLADSLTSSPADPIDALGCLEQGLAECGRGRRGLIHATPQLLVHWVQQYAVRLEGGVFLTPLGNIVVADAGYPGTGPNGEDTTDSQWAYATDMLSIRLGQPEVIPGDLVTAQEWAQSLDRSVNTVTVWAQRTALYQWDACCHLAAEVDLTGCLVAGVS